MKRLALLSTVVAVVLVGASTAESAALVCGAVQMRYFGMHDKNFRLAKNWARLLPHTTAHEGAVVVQSRRGRDSAGNPGGHVSRIVSMRGSCRAIVADEKGQYERDICKRLIAYVDPNGDTATARETSVTRHFSAKRKHHRRRQTVSTAFVPPDRLMVH